LGDFKKEKEKENTKKENGPRDMYVYR